MSGVTDPASLAAAASILRAIARDAASAAERLSQRGAPDAARLPPAARAAVREVSRAASLLAQVTEGGAAELSGAAYRHAQREHEHSLLLRAAREAGICATERGFALPSGISGVADAVIIATRESAVSQLRAADVQVRTQIERDRAHLIESLEGLTIAAERLANQLR